MSFTREDLENLAEKKMIGYPLSDEELKALEEDEADCECLASSKDMIDA